MPLIIIKYLSGNEAGNNVEEGFLQTEANGVKILGSPIMPSPVLLWRFKVFLLVMYIYLFIFLVVQFVICVGMLY